VTSCAQCPLNQVVACVTEPVFSDSIAALTTPYGTTQFDGQDFGNTRYLKVTYPDGGSEIVQYDQTNNVPQSEPAATVPTGMLTYNSFLPYRNTYYWDRIAAASYPDHSKARLFHWLHREDGSTTSGALESTRQPLENRVWFDYTGQTGTFASLFIASNTLPAHVGRVLDDGSTQLYTYEYNPFGYVTRAIDPVGRAFSYIYGTNGIDLLEIRQTRGTNNEPLFQASYNSQHRPLTVTDIAGQTTTFAYNAHGQVLSIVNARDEMLSFDYNLDGYLLAIHGPLPTNEVRTVTYDTFGRVRTFTDVSGYTLTFDYDGLDRTTRMTHPDGTFEQITYDRLDTSTFRDRSGRLTSFVHDSLRQVTQITDPLGRSTRLGWCRCGGLSTLTDPMGRTTSWRTDIQGRTIAKQFADGSQITYNYENTASRLRQITDENQQSTFFAYELDNTFRSVSYGNATTPTPSVSFSYDPCYERLTSVTDGAGTTSYSYNPITATPTPGAGRLATVAGPLPNQAITYGYDELGRVVHRAINGVDSVVSYDAAGRVVGASNALGSFSYTYDGSSLRMLSAMLANGQTMSRAYGGVLQDLALQRITHQMGTTPLSEFLYTRDTPAHRISAWSQQPGTQSPDVYSFGYDAANQLLSAAVTNSGALVNSFAYSYDTARNRLSETVGSSTALAAYNALNQLSTMTGHAASRTNEWDAANRLTAVKAGNARTEFSYDGANRLVGIRQLVSGVQVSHRLFAWGEGGIAEERDTNGVVTKRYFAQGVQLVTGANAGSYYYSRDHLGSIRELTDATGNVRARYAYDPFGRRTKLGGDLDADFGFAGMFWAAEASLNITRFRAYDPELGRWLSRDPVGQAELSQGPNLYAYVGNEPVDRVDPLGLCTGSTICACFRSKVAAVACAEAGIIAAKGAQEAAQHAPELIQEVQELAESPAAEEVQALPQCIQAAQQAPAVIQQAQTAATGPIGLSTAIQQAQPLANTISADPAVADTMLTEDTAIAENIASQNESWAQAWSYAQSQFMPNFLDIGQDFEAAKDLIIIRLSEYQRFLDLLNSQDASTFGVK